MAAKSGSQVSNQTTNAINQGCLASGERARPYLRSRKCSMRLSVGRLPALPSQRQPGPVRRRHPALRRPHQ